MTRRARNAGTLSPLLAEIAAAGREDLLALWPELVGGLAPKSISQPMLRRILAFEAQARTEGGLSKADRKQIAAVAQQKRRPTADRLSLGGRFIREWNGVSHVVDVTSQGYRWRGTDYRSLSAIAREITGAHWSGPRFFGLQKERRDGTAGRSA